MIKRIKAVVLAIVLALSNFNSVIYAYQVNNETRDIEVLESEANQVTYESEEIEGLDGEENQVIDETEDIEVLEDEENQVIDKTEDVECLENEENQVKDETEGTYALKYKAKNDKKKIYVLNTEIKPTKNQNDELDRGDADILDRGEADINNKIFKKSDNYLKEQVADATYWSNDKYGIALKNVEKVYDHFVDKFGIKGIDGKGLVPYILPNSSIARAAFMHDGNKLKQAMLLGINSDTAKSMVHYKDVIAHEYTHGVLQYKYKLDPREDGAPVHEALADFFACTFDGNWTIAEDKNKNNVHFRDIKNPELVTIDPEPYIAANGKKKDKYPNHYSYRYIYDKNNKDKNNKDKENKKDRSTYINSTIISHLLYLIATGEKISGKGIGKNETAKLALRAIESLPINKSDGWRKSTIETFAGALLKNASSKEKDTVINALKEVGMFDVAKTSVKSVELNKTKLTMIKGKSETLKATINPDNATDKNVTWKSSNEKIAKVDKNGNVTAISPGTTTITVTTKDGNKKATCNVTVQIPVTSVKLNKTKLTMIKGRNETLKPTINPDNASNTNVTWSSSNKNVATVDGKGNVKAVGAGTATITVTTKDGNKKATCKVKVNNPYKIRKVNISVNLPKSFKQKHYVEILDGNNKVIKTYAARTGSSSYTFTYQLDTSSSSYSRKIRIRTVSGNKKYDSNLFKINSSTINKNVTVTFTAGTSGSTTSSLKTGKITQK